MRSHPITVSIRELVTAMIETSDNTATNQADRDGRHGCRESILEDMGFTATNCSDGCSSLVRRRRIGKTSPLRLKWLVWPEMLYRGKAVDAEASREMIEILKLVDANFRPRIPPGLPNCFEAWRTEWRSRGDRNRVSPGRPFVLSVMSTYLDRGVNPVPEVARMVYEYFENARIRILREQFTMSAWTQ